MKIEVQKKDEVAVISLGEDLEQSWTLEDLQSVVTEIGENIKKVILHGKELGNEAQSEIGDIACSNSNISHNLCASWIISLKVINLLLRIKKHTLGQTGFAKL